MSSSEVPKKKKYTDEERRALMEKLDKETEEFMQEASRKSKLRKMNQKVDDTEDDDMDDILATHPAFLKPDGELTQEQIDANPLLKGLQMIKYDDDEDSPYDRALAHKVDGNFFFKKKIYKKARSAYTEGLKQWCQNKELLTILHTNRAAANFHLQNYRSSYLDAQAAVELDPKRIKSLTRCAQCCDALKKYEQAIEWSKVILSLDEDNEFARKCLADNIRKRKEQERNERKKKMEKKKLDDKMRVLKDAIASRNVTLDTAVLKKKDGDEDDGEEEVGDVEINKFIKQLKSPTGKQVYLENGDLFWPVLFMYPQYKTSDFIEAFEENTCVGDHLECMFADKAVWDEEFEFRCGNFAVFVENYKEEKLYEIPIDVPLKKLLSSPKLIVRTGTPGFYILAKSSSHYTEFVGKYAKVYKLPFSR